MQLKKYETLIYIIIAYLFSVAMRYTWIHYAAGIDSFSWHGQTMINTNDGYFWLSGVKNLFDNSLAYNPRVPGLEYGLVAFTYFLAKILPFSMDTIALYLPIFISSLVVIPVILIMKLYNKPLLGFLAALITSIAWSFYNRTMAGYYDTDLFAIVFPVFIIYFLIRTVKEDNLNTLFVAMLLNALYFYAYDASKPVIYGIGIGFIIYCLIFKYKSQRVFDYIFLISISMLDIDWRIRLILIIASFILIKSNIIKNDKIKLIISIISVILFLWLNQVFGIIWDKIYEYIATGVEQVGRLKFYQVHQTISEAGKIPFNIFANRISGSVIGFIIATAGYFLLAFRKKEFWLFLPLVGIGFFAYIGGLRFTVYAIAPLSLGVVYLFWVVSQYIENKKVQYAFVIFATLAFLYPNIKHIFNYNRAIRTVFTKGEVKDLDALNKIATNKDYTLTWWDYGYPIWYYSETNTLIDGGKHNNDNFVVSKIMQTTSPILAANLSRLSVEGYVKKDYSYTPIINDLIKESNLSANEFLASLKNKDYKLPSKTRDVYLYMPLRMANIFSTVMLFGNLDLTTGKKLREAMFYPAYLRAKKGDMLMLSNGLVIDAKKGLVYFGKNALKIKYLVETKRDSSGKISVSPSIYNKDGVLALLYLKSTGQLIVMDMQTFNSMYVQMGLLGNYDKDLFELVIKSPYSRIYKLKR